VALGEGAPQRPSRAVGVAVEPGDARGHHLGHLWQRREGALVGGELDGRIEAEAREHLGGGEAGLVAGHGLEPG
jgi:hypothetical protein